MSGISAVLGCALKSACIKPGKTNGYIKPINPMIVQSAYIRILEKLVFPFSGEVIFQMEISREQYIYQFLNCLENIAYHRINLRVVLRERGGCWLCQFLMVTSIWQRFLGRQITIGWK
jgi:hypothetical protein